MSTARQVVFGGGQVGSCLARMLLERGERVVAVYTHADNPAEQRWFPSVADLAYAHGVPVHRDVDFAAAGAIAQLRSYAPDLDLRGFAASGPASAWEEQWRAGVAVDGPWIAMHAMLIYAWADYYGFKSAPLWAVMP
jgi:nucleoside-diphosphate-sugar epimerase